MTARSSLNAHGRMHCSVDAVDLAVRMRLLMHSCSQIRDCSRRTGAATHVSEAELTIRQLVDVVGSQRVERIGNDRGHIGRVNSRSDCASSVECSVPYSTSLTIQDSDGV